MFHDNAQCLLFFRPVFYQRGGARAHHTAVPHAPVTGHVRLDHAIVDIDIEADEVVAVKYVDLPALPGRVNVKTAVSVAVIHGHHIGQPVINQAEMA
ncbi:MAG: hypothetical protein NTV42_02015 [Chloroflexi bacterium]|nr:hypothetical protein [Chloroflexota bacterium]